MTQMHGSDSEIQIDCTNTTVKAKVGTAMRRKTSTQTTWLWSVLLKDNDDVFSSGRHRSTISSTNHGPLMYHSNS